MGAIPREPSVYSRPAVKPASAVRLLRMIRCNSGADGKVRMREGKIVSIHTQSGFSAMGKETGLHI